MSTETFSAVVPLRFSDTCLEDGSPRFVLRGVPLWDWTLALFRESGLFESVVIAYDDPRMESFLKGLGGPVVPYLRPAHLSRQGVKSLDVAAHVVREEVVKPTDWTMQMEISHPLRTAALLGRIVSCADGSDADSLVTVKPVHYNFWQQDNRGARRIVGSGDAPDRSLFRELAGIGSVFRRKSLLDDNVYGVKTDLIPIDTFWASIDVRDADSLWLAEQFCLKKGLEPGLEWLA